MALTFDLVQALNNTGTAGQAIFGDFRAGYYIGNDPNTFTVFEQYRYRVGGADPYLLPLNSGMELGWFSNVAGQNEYPHVAVENINGNAEITSSLWGESMYFHPGTLNGVYADYTSAESRPCVIRFVCPEDGNALSIVGNFLKGDYFTNPATGFSILKNGVEIFTRTVVTGGNSIPINLLNIPLMQGDVIDFVVDVNEGSTSQDDSAVTVTLTLQLDKTSKPSVNGIVSCSDTSISGTIPLANTGTWTITGLNISAYGGQTLKLTAVDAPSTISDDVLVAVQDLDCEGCDTPLISGIVNCSTTQINGTVGCNATGNSIRLGVVGGGIISETSIVVSGGGGAFSLSPLNLTESKGLGLYVVMVDSLGVEISDRTFVVVGDDGCKEDDYASVPVITVSDLCKKKCSYQRTLTGTSDFNGEVLIFKAPFDSMNPELVSTGIISGGVWTSRSENIKDRVKYVAIGIRHDGIEGGVVAIDALQNCEKECVLTGTLKGTASNISLGILNIYAVPFTTSDLPIATTTITNGQWSLKDDVLLEDTDYVLYAIKLNAI
jgi:hypothetical protein